MKILDACCGSRMFWYDKHEAHTTYMDIRKHYEELPTGHVINVSPDVLGDFRKIPFDDETFDLVVFDPPHLLNAGKTSWLAKKYGVLPADWEGYLKEGYTECQRVLKPTGTINFKWNSEQIPFSEILKVIDDKPIFGDKRSKTRWCVFIKKELKL